MESFIRDLRKTVRSWLRRPGLAIAVVLTLGPGLGGAIVVFDLTNLLAWRPPPVARPDEVVDVFAADPRLAYEGAASYLDYLDYREAAASLSGLAASMTQTVTFEAGSASAKVGALAVSGNYFEVLGVGAAAGRTLAPDDDREGAPPAVVLGFGLWQRLLGADRAWIGRSISLDGHPFTVVGVAREGFAGTRAGVRSQLFLPLAHLPSVTADNRVWLTDRRRAAFALLGRLRPGATAAATAAELEVVAARLEREAPLPDLERRISVRRASMGHPAQRSELASTVRLLTAAVAVLLVIACANVAQLLLARAMARSRELGIRRALGAGGARLLRQALTETCLLALLGGLWGLFLASWARSFLAFYIGEGLARDLRFDHRVLGFALAACLLATLLAGLVPALVQVRTDLVASLKSGGTGTTGRGPRLAPLLVGAQVALSALLLVTTGLIGRSLWNLRTADPGFAADRLVCATMWAQPKRLPDLGRGLYRRAAARAAALPGVAAVGRAQALPPADVTTRFRLQESPEPERTSHFNVVDGGYFAALGIPLRSGRVFDERDGEGGRGVVVVSQALADELWPDGDAVGRTVWVEPQRAWEPAAAHEVIGVVGSLRQREAPHAPEPVLYFSYEQHYRPILYLTVSTEGDRAPVMSTLRRELRDLDQGLEILEVQTYEDYVWEGLGRERLLTQAIATFALLGWFLAVIGVAGVTSYAVSRGVRDIGVRMALGARAQDVLVQVLGRGLRLAAAGLVLGIAGAVVAARLLGHLLYDVGPADPAVLGLVSAALLGSATAAAYLPARRASRVDPVHALRQE